MCNPLLVRRAQHNKGFPGSAEGGYLPSCLTKNLMELSFHRVRVEGIEPSTSSLSEKRSANELHAHHKVLVPYHIQKQALCEDPVFVS